MGDMARILVVDDDESIRTVFRVNLERQGYFVDTAEDGEGATQLIRDGDYNLALIDIRLPDMDGIELLNVIDEELPEMIKIIVTGFPTLQNAIEAVNRGADGYILKPVKIETLLEMIEAHLSRQESEKYGEDRVSDYIDARARELKNQMKFYEPI
ncbi:MAG: response regulator [Candidatus Bathyarchaeota archaeon]|nr:MAG: response regulator [Candidatus Bathyarchaeota archaeon]